MALVHEQWSRFEKCTDIVELVQRLPDGRNSDAVAAPWRMIFHEPGRHGQNKLEKQTSLAKAVIIPVTIFNLGIKILCR